MNLPMKTPERQIRAVFNQKTIRVYQAYSTPIAHSAVDNGTFVSPPFKMSRMTWIKPSFLWMMYRCGWSEKDAGQKHVLAIDISREGFEWALAHSLLGEKSKTISDRTHWEHLKATHPVRIQWDPERDFHFNPLDHRSIQIGLSGEAVEFYVNDWIQSITDVTDLASQMHTCVKAGNLEDAHKLMPVEKPYPLPEALAKHIEITR